MIAFEYNAIYNNSSVCMKLKTAGNTCRINKSTVFIFTVAFYRDKILILIIFNWLHLEKQQILILPTLTEY